MAVAKVFKLVKRFDGLPKEDDFNLVEEELASPKEGEVLCKTIYLTVDPYMRVYVAALPLGITMIGEVLARVTESKSPDFKEGDLVASRQGWSSAFLATSDKLEKITHLPEGVPESLALGCLGMPGRTAYFGLLDVAGPVKSGETVLVNGAAGAVGTVVGQIAKIKGCRVIGYAGSDKKVEMLKSLGFDEAFNYKTVDLDESLSKAAPKGVNIYFDNVGGEFSDTVLTKHMCLFGRVPICGCISQYNKKGNEHGLFPYSEGKMLYGSILGKQLKVQGFIVTTFNDKKKEANEQLAEWLKEGKLKYKETVTEGFENTPKAFIGLLTGENFGKAVVKV
ncbi:prostaglandin reductase 1-like [Oscarella lobularis]|uniref:prostaglandin reductase 1-like n=1 Tax=Oscarella lobularis TaxID=121494 RepID=UPI003313C45C